MSIYSYLICLQIRRTERWTSSVVCLWTVALCPTRSGSGLLNWRSSVSGLVTSVASCGSLMAVWAKFWPDTTKRAPFYPALSVGVNLESRPQTLWRVYGIINRAILEYSPGKYATDCSPTQCVTNIMCHQWAPSVAF